MYKQHNKQCNSNSFKTGTEESCMFVNVAFTAAELTKDTLKLSYLLCEHFVQHSKWLR